MHELAYNGSTDVNLTGQSAKYSISEGEVEIANYSYPDIAQTIEKSDVCGGIGICAWLGVLQSHIFFSFSSASSAAEARIMSDVSRLYFPFLVAVLTSKGFPESTRSKCLRASGRLP